jgi:hypothetical protein
MFDWVWKIIASMAALVAGYLTIRNSHLKYQAERDKAERAAASQKQESDAIGRLSAVRSKYNAQAKPDASKRTDFEGDGV